MLPPAGLASGSSVSPKAQKIKVIAPEGSTFAPPHCAQSGKARAEVTELAVGGMQE